MPSLEHPPRPHITKTWRECCEASKSLSSKKTLAKWQVPRTKKLKEWGRLVHLNNPEQAQRLEAWLKHKDNREIAQLLNELLDVLSVHLHALIESPSATPSVVDSASDIWDWGETEMSQSVHHDKHEPGKPAARQVSATSRDDQSNENDFLGSRVNAVQRGNSEMTSSTGSVWEPEHDRESTKPGSESFESSYDWSQIQNNEVPPSAEESSRPPVFKTSTRESKKMIDTFIQHLFNFTDSVELGPSAPQDELSTPLDRPSELLDKPSTPPDEPSHSRGDIYSSGPGETAYRDYAYHRTYGRVTKMAPYADKFMWHRISRVSSVRMMELAVAKRRLISSLHEPPYYAGKYTFDCPEALDNVLRRVSSSPTPVRARTEGDGGKELGNTKPRRHTTFPPYLRLNPQTRKRQKGTDDLVLLGIGYESNLELRHLLEGLDVTGQSPPHTVWGPRRQTSSSSTSKQSHGHLFVCYVDPCPTPFVAYDCRTSWEEHIRTMHPQAIPRPPPAPEMKSAAPAAPSGVWICRAWSHVSKKENGGYPSFDDELLFHQHMYDRHAFDGDEDVLRTITKACYQPSPPPQKSKKQHKPWSTPRPGQLTCPLCQDSRWDIAAASHDTRVERRNNEDDDGDNSERINTQGDLATAFLDHVADHFAKISKRIFSSVPTNVPMASINNGKFGDQEERTVTWLAPSETGSAVYVASDIESNEWFRDTIEGLSTSKTI